MPTNTPQFYVPTNVVFRIVTATSIEILNFIGVFLPIADSTEIERLSERMGYIIKN